MAEHSNHILLEIRFTSFARKSHGRAGALLGASEKQISPLQMMSYQV